jgi:hypothetical protein
MTQSNYPYQTSFEGQSPYGEQKVYGRSKWKLGCFGFIGAVILLIIIIIVGIFFVYPAMTPNKLKGDLMNVVLVPGKDGSNKLWILADGSFHYVQETKSPGHYSVGRKCLFCKTWTYVYDPAQKKVLNKIKTEYETIITQSWISYGNGKVWIITGAYDENEPRVFAYDAETSERIMETKDFIKKYPELQSGITDVRMDKNPDRIVMNTKDGRTGVVFVINENKLYTSDSEYRKTQELDKDKQVTVFALSSEDSGPRKKLYKVTGPKGNVKAGDISESYFKDPKTLMFFAKATAEMLTPNRVYIEGMIFHQDPECCLIVHQSVAGKEADRMLTCVDISGKEKWTAPQSMMFDELKVDENDNPFSKIFFMKDNIGVIRSGNLVVLQLKDVGIIGFDYNTGNKLWELEF